MYIDLILCKSEQSDKPILFRSPAFSNLKKGDAVICENGFGGECWMYVISKYTVDPASEEFAFICKANRAVMPLRKVLKMVEYSNLNYENEEEYDAIKNTYGDF